MVAMPGEQLWLLIVLTLMLAQILVPTAQAEQTLRSQSRPLMAVEGE